MIFSQKKVKFSLAKVLYLERYLYACKLLGTVWCASEMESNARIWSYEPIFTRIKSQVLNSSMVTSNCVNFNYFTTLFWEQIFTRIISCVNWSELPSSESFNAFIGQSFPAWDSSLWITWVMPSINCDTNTDSIGLQMQYKYRFIYKIQIEIQASESLRSCHQ